MRKQLFSRVKTPSDKGLEGPGCHCLNSAEFIPNPQGLEFGPGNPSQEAESVGEGEHFQRNEEDEEPDRALRLCAA